MRRGRGRRIANTPVYPPSNVVVEKRIKTPEEKV